MQTFTVPPGALLLEGSSASSSRPSRAIQPQGQQEPEEASCSDRAELHRALERITTTGIRAALAGLVLRGGLHAATSLIYLLTKVLRSPKHPPRRRELSWLAALEDTLKYTAFLGAMGTVYVTVDEGLAALLGKQRTAKWRALVAGAVAGQTLLLTGPRTKQYSLGTYVLLRGLTLLIRAANKPGSDPRLRALLAPTRLQHGDTVLMCLSAAQIVYSFIMMPSTLPKSYVRFISKQGAKEPWVWKAVQEQALRNSQGEEPAPLNLLRGTPYADVQSRIPCPFYHPGHTCTSHAFSGIPASYMRALGVYAPMYLVPALLVHRQKLLSHPLEIWPKVALGMARSSLFLTLYITLAFSGVCVAFNLTGTNTPALIASSVWVGGLATLVEKKSRRMELALYCLSRALESFFRCLGEWGVVDASQLPWRMDALLFSAGCAAIMNCYSGDNGKDRDVFRSKYLNVLDFIFGGAGVDAGRIHHMPSNGDFIRVASHHIIQTYSGKRLLELERKRRAQRTGHTADTASSSNMRSSQSTARVHRAILLGGANPGSSPRLQESGRRDLRRSFTDPSFGPCEDRVHGADRGIRSHLLQMHGEPSLNDLRSLLHPTPPSTPVVVQEEEESEERVSVRSVTEMGGGAGEGRVRGSEESAASVLESGGSCELGVAGVAREEEPESPRWGEALWGGQGRRQQQQQQQQQQQHDVSAGGDGTGVNGSREG